MLFFGDLLDGSAQYFLHPVQVDAILQVYHHAVGKLFCQLEVVSQQFHLQLSHAEDAYDSTMLREFGFHDQCLSSCEKKKKNLAYNIVTTNSEHFPMTKRKKQITENHGFILLIF
jgi:hypothetical protein